LREALESTDDLFGCPSLLASTGVAPTYHELRILELELVKKIDPICLDQLPPRDPLADAWAYMCKPRGYPKDKIVDVTWIERVRRLAGDRFSSSYVDDERPLLS